MRRILLLLFPTLFALLPGTGCSGSSSGNPVRTEIIVFASASLTEAFGDIEASFEAAHPGIAVTISYGAGSALREQILDGAPADVYASADPSHMDLLEARGLVFLPAGFARNRMQIAVPVGNPAGVTSLSDFARPELLIGLCAPPTPCGDLGRRVLTAAAVSAQIDTNEPNVRALLTKIEAGELDAGIVFVTDVASSRRVEGIAIPDEWNAETIYPIAVLSSSLNPTAAGAFVDFVLSPTGRAILGARSFLDP